MDDRLGNPADIWTMARSLSSPSDADLFFGEFLQWVQRTPPPDSLQARGILSTALRALTAATARDPESAEQIIMRHVLPTCVGSPDGMPVSVAEPYTLREYLADWIEQYPEEERHLLRARVISNTLPLLRSAAQEPAIWTICAIGFRSPDIERALLRVARSNSAAGNAAISCLAALHPGNEVKEALVRKAVRRLAERRAGTLDLAVQELASPQFLSALSRT